MNYTQNYQLPQWVAADRVLMDDFNDAMDKIDEGLTEVQENLTAADAACPIVKLRDGTAQETTTQIDLNLTGIDLEPYNALLVEIYPSAGSSQNASICIQCNNLSNIYHRNDVTSNGLADFSLGVNVQAALMHARIMLMAGGLVGLPLHSHWNNTNNYHYVDCLDCGCGTTAVNKSTLQSLNVVVLGSGKYLGSGTRVILRGVRL